MPDIINNHVNRSIPLVHSYSFGKDVNITNANIQDILAQNYSHIVFDSSTRTIWYEGVPYGLSYQFNDSSSVNNIVLGDSLTHSISGSDNTVSGSSNQISSVIKGGFAFGSYNKCDDLTYSYIFTIGNGTSDSSRSNLMAIHKAKDSSDRTTTSLTGYLNVEYLESNISASYVSSLGKSATADIILKALLTPTEYYRPSGLSFTLYNTLQNIECGYVPANVTISQGLKLPSKMSKYDYTYIANYIRDYSKLPNGVKLEHLGYAWTFIDDGGDWWTDGDVHNIIVTYASQYINNKLETVNKGNKIYKSPPVNIEDSTLKLIENTNTVAKLDSSNNGNIVIDFKSNTLNEPKRYQFGKKIDVHVKYTYPQLSYFEQLVDNGVFVVSDSKAWTGITQLDYSVGDNFCTVYTGYNVFYGMCTVEPGKAQDSAFFKDLLEKYINNPEQYSSIHSGLETANKSTILSSSVSEITFYENRIGSGSSNKYNCAFICFPDRHLAVTSTDGGSHYWLYKSGPGDPESIVSGVSGGDPRNYNYTFSSKKLCKTGSDMDWCVVAVKSPNNFSMSVSTSNWYGLKIKANKTF